MDLGSSRLIFTIDLLSPLPLVCMFAALVAVAYYGYTSIRTAGKLHGTVFVTLRVVAMITLGVVLLQPALVSSVPVQVVLPDGFVTVSKRILTAARSGAILPHLETIALPTPPDRRDVRIVNLHTPPVAFYKSRCEVTVTLNNEGPEQAGELVVSRLTSDGPRELSRSPLTLRTGEQRIAVSLVPDRLGNTAFALFLRKFAVDEEPANNSMPFSLQVVRESLRVLHVAGHPSWDVRFLRELLTSLAGIELVSFYLLVEAEDFAPHSREELSLIPFPTDELFLKDIGIFDVIIVQNFPLGTYFLLTDKHMRRLVQFVEEGGGLLLIGGDRAFSLGQVEATELAPILPVSLVPPASETAYREDSCQVRLAADGLVHPLMRIPGEDNDGAMVLSDLPPIDGFNVLGEAKAGGQVMASAVVGETTYPLLIAGNHKAGRILMVATDALWQWAFPGSLKGEPASRYRRLYMNALAWLSHDPRQADLDLFPALDRLEEGQECDVTICLHGNADPDTLVHVNAEWLDLAGQLPAVRMAQDIPFHSDHCAQVSLPPSKPGAWVVEASVETENREYRGTDIVVVSTGVETYKESLLRRIEPLLEEQFTPLAIDHPFSLRLDPASRTLQRPVLTTVWVSPLFFMVIVACLLMEWTLRRRWGYL